jgi:hypothetical protein
MNTEQLEQWIDDNTRRMKGVDGLVIEAVYVEDLRALFAGKALVDAIASRDEPVAAVTGYHAGHCVIEPIDRAVLLPVGMALYSGAQAAVPNTHRIVSVELLESLASRASQALMAADIARELKAIIDKETK